MNSKQKRKKRRAEERKERLEREKNPFASEGFREVKVSSDYCPEMRHLIDRANELLEELPDYELIFEMEESKVVIMSNKRQPQKIPGSLI